MNRNSSVLLTDMAGLLSRLKQRYGQETQDRMEARYKPSPWASRYAGAGPAATQPYQPPPFHSMPGPTPSPWQPPARREMPLPARAGTVNALRTPEQGAPYGISPFYGRQQTTDTPAHMGLIRLLAGLLG